MMESPPVPPGWYTDGQDPRLRFWDGSQWTDRYEELDKSLSSSTPDAKVATLDRSIWKRLRANAAKHKKLGKLTKEQRFMILEAQIARLARKGWKLEATVFGTKASLRRSKWWLFGQDLLLVLLTAGLWLIYMAYRRLIGRSTSLIVSVNRFGKVSTTRWTEDLLGG